MDSSPEQEGKATIIPQFWERHAHPSSNPLGVASSTTTTTTSASVSVSSQHPFTDNDVLSGRGVTVSNHIGNQRLRALVNAQLRRYPNFQNRQQDDKILIAKEILAHIRQLRPPGRFLQKRGGGKTRKSRGLEGPWDEVDDEGALKKIKQALRDGHRSDRTQYFTGVAPEDVLRFESQTTRSAAPSPPALSTAVTDTSSTTQSETNAARAETPVACLPNITPATTLAAASIPHAPPVSIQQHQHQHQQQQHIAIRDSSLNFQLTPAPTMGDLDLSHHFSTFHDHDSKPSHLPPSEKEEEGEMEHIQFSQHETEERLEGEPHYDDFTGVLDLDSELHADDTDDGFSTAPPSPFHEGFPSTFATSTTTQEQHSPSPSLHMGELNLDEQS